MGLRYEFNAPPVDADDRMRIYDQDTSQIVQVGTDGVPRSGIASDYNNVAPRIGFNYDLTGMGTTMLQGGYGLFYNIGTLIETSALYFNPPYFGIGLYFPTQTAPADAREPVPRAGHRHAADLQLARPEHAHGLRAPGQPRPRARLREDDGGRPLRRLVRPATRAQAQHQPGRARARARSRRAVRCRSTATSSWSSRGRPRTTTRCRSAPCAAPATASRSAARTPGPSRWTTSRRSSPPTATTTRRRTAATSPPSGACRTSTSGTGAVFSGSYVPSRTWAPAALGRGWQVAGVVSVQSGRPFTPRVSFDNSNSGNTGGGTFAYDRPNEVTGTDAAGRRHRGQLPGPLVRHRAAVHLRQRRPQRPDRTGLRVGRRGAVAAPRARRHAQPRAAPRGLQPAQPHQPPAARQLRGPAHVRAVAVGATRVASSSWRRVSRSESAASRPRSSRCA